MCSRWRIAYNKKSIITIISIIVTLFVIACGSAAPPTPTSAPAPEPTAAPPAAEATSVPEATVGSHPNPQSHYCARSTPGSERHPHHRPAQRAGQRQRLYDDHHRIRLDW